MNARALIAEDEPILAATLARALVRLWPGLDIVATAPNGVAAVDDALALRPDVLFLDIRMPGQTGLEAAEELAERWPPGVAFPLIVFVTAFDDYALQAFERAALDYVLKPINDARLGLTVERLRRQLAGTRPASGAAGADSDPGLARLVEQLRALLPPAAPQRLATIRAAVGNTIRMIPVADVVYFQALDKYVNVVALDGEALIRTSLRDLLAQLDPAAFCQVSRAAIVNLRHVAAATRDDAGKMLLTLRGRDDRLRVSSLYAHLFRQM
jgi:DNA-binding LytR/AlgR family response regulator